jgi:hypothetical protein
MLTRRETLARTGNARGMSNQRRGAAPLAPRIEELMQVSPKLLHQNVFGAHTARQ